MPPERSSLRYARPCVRSRASSRCGWLASVAMAGKAPSTSGPPSDIRSPPAASPSSPSSATRARRSRRSWSLPTSRGRWPASPASPSTSCTRSRPSSPRCAALSSSTASTRSPRSSKALTTPSRPCTASTPRPTWSGSTATPTTGTLSPSFGSDGPRRSRPARASCSWATPATTITPRKSWVVKELESAGPARLLAQSRAPGLLELGRLDRVRVRAPLRRGGRVPHPSPARAVRGRVGVTDTQPGFDGLSGAGPTDGHPAGIATVPEGVTDSAQTRLVLVRHGEAVCNVPGSAVE